MVQNERDPSIVPELEEIGKDCNITLDTPIYLDSGYSRLYAIQQLVDIERETYWNNGTKFPVCATIGPVDASTHMGLSTLTETWHVPQLAYATTNTLLSQADRFPTFVRLLPDAKSFANVIVDAVFPSNDNNNIRDHDDWLWRPRMYLTVLHAQEYGIQIAQALELRLPGLSVENIGVNPKNVEQALDQVVKHGHRTILVAADDTQWDLMEMIATEAVARGLVGKDFLWLLTGDALPDGVRKSLVEPPESALARFLDGAFVFSNFDPFYYKPEESAFLKAWRAQDVTMMQNAARQQPTNAVGRDPFWGTLPADYFRVTPPGTYASFLYDAVLATGISACGALQSDPPDDHYQTMLRTPFTGASGRVQFDVNPVDGTTTSNRNVTTTVMGLHNIRVVVDFADFNDIQSIATFESATVALYLNGRWERTGEEVRYNGGSTEEPLPLITVFDSNFLSRGIQQMGFALIALSLLLNAVSVLWIIWRRNDRRIQASQPEFLYLLCFGSALVSIATLFVSFDEDKGWSTEQLSRGCIAFPWFFVCGYMAIYAALAFKLWRIGQVMQMRRKIITLRQMLLPLVAVFVCLLTILLLWSLLDPLRWERVFVDGDPRFTSGTCRMEDGGMAFIVPLGIVIVGAVAATARFGWKCRDMQSELAESRWILFGIFGHLQLWIMVRTD